MNAAQAASMLGVSARHVYDLAAPAGPIPCTRIGRRVVFDEADILQFKAKCRCAAAASPARAAFRPAVAPAGARPLLQAVFRRLGIKPKLKP